MHRPEPPKRSRLEALMDERDHLHAQISLEADAAAPNVDRLGSLSRQLAQIESEMAMERRRGRAALASRLSAQVALR